MDENLTSTTDGSGPRSKSSGSSGTSELVLLEGVVPGTNDPAVIQVPLDNVFALDPVIRFVEYVDSITKEREKDLASANEEIHALQQRLEDVVRRSLAALQAVILS